MLDRCGTIGSRMRPPPAIPTALPSAFDKAEIGVAQPPRQFQHVECALLVGHRDVRRFVAIAITTPSSNNNAVDGSGTLCNEMSPFT